MEITCTTVESLRWRSSISTERFFDALDPGAPLRCFAGWSLWFAGAGPGRGTLARRKIFPPHSY